VWRSPPKVTVAEVMGEEAAEELQSAAVFPEAAREVTRQ